MASSGCPPPCGMTRDLGRFIGCVSVAANRSSFGSGAMSCISVGRHAERRSRTRVCGSER
eukprot:4573297-Pyramimonas_sp.AAC.1